MPSLGVPEIMILLVVALVVFGPRKLPELGRSLGHGLREFRRSTQGLTDEFGSLRQSVSGQPVSSQPVRVPVEVPAPLATPEFARTEHAEGTPPRS